MINRYLLILLMLVVPIIGQTGSIYDSPHNLSASGPGSIKAQTESEVCIFCHASHSGDSQAALWNRSSSVVNYTIYGSSTMETNAQQPGTASRLCLGCHDGTIALGLVLNRADPIAFPVGFDKIPTGYRSNLSSDLSDDHPLNLDAHPTGFNCSGCHNSSPMTSDKMGCTSCHDPHDDSQGNFLVVDPVSGALCNQCHQETNWSLSSHSLSTATWNGIDPDPWPYTSWSTVSENACASCHTSHGGSGSTWLLKSSAEEDNCLVCHNGNVAALDIQSELNKTSTHAVTNYSDIHTPSEVPPITVHVECTDCHHPHQTTGTSAVAPDSPGALTGVSGMDKTGVMVDQNQFAYEVCLKCHSTDIASIPTYVPWFNNTSILNEFSEDNPSYHPVFGVGINQNVPSLIAPWSETSIMYCTDCHNNDSASPAGPHGSMNVPLLAQPQVFTDYNRSSTSLYALCYECHSSASILSDVTFSKHKKHIQREQTACTTCHDPHGSTTNSHLINFNTDYVFPNQDGLLEWVDYGNNSGACYLLCHGEDHNPEDY